MFEKDFLADSFSSRPCIRALLSIALKTIILALFISNANLVLSADWTPCEAPCNDVYTNVYTPSPASGSSHPTGDTVRFTINVARDGVSSAGTYIPFSTIVTTSGGTGFSTATIAPSGNYCIYGSGASLSCAAYSSSPNVNVVIDVTVGTGTSRIQVKLNNLLGAFYASPVFYFDVTGTGSVRITGLTDMNGTWNGTGDATNSDDVCLYSSDGSYDILVEGPTDSGDYVLESGANKIPITVYWNDDTGTTGRTTLDSANNPSLSGVTGGDTSSQTCSGGNTANISWKALESDLQTKAAGTYTATMTITATAP